MTERRERWLAGLALVVLSVLAYAPGLTSPFSHYDDPLYVWDNLKRLTPGGLDGFFLQWNSERAWRGEFVEHFPLRDSVYWALYQLYELEPTPYHVVSLFFHLASSLLAWLFFSLIGLPRRAAWLGALIFALHPVHIESVVWIAGLKDPMFTSFMLLGLAAYASYRKQPAPWKYALMLVGMVCGFFVKSLIVAMPIIMLAMELLLPPRVSWKEIAARLAGPFIVTGLFFAQIMAIGKANNVLIPPHGGSWQSHTIIAAWAQVKYLKQTLMPTSFRLIYCFEPPTGWLDWRLWVAVGVLVTAVLLAWRWRREPLLLFLVAFYVAAIAPVSNIVPFPATMADRYLYSPSIASCGVLALLAMKLPLRSFRIIVVGVALLLTGATASRAWLWHDEEALWIEADLDPACLVDTAFPPAQTHVLRYYTSKDPVEGLMALERAMVSPGFKMVGEDMQCRAIIGAAFTAHALGNEARSTTWALLATTICPLRAEAWNLAMNVTMHKKPEQAAGAATKAWRLHKSPETESLMWLTRLEAGDASVVEKIEALAKQGDWHACRQIRQFSENVPRLGPQLGEAHHLCEAVLARPPPPTQLPLYVK